MADSDKQEADLSKQIEELALSIQEKGFFLLNFHFFKGQFLSIFKLPKMHRRLWRALQWR
jgi:hypothetical protein